MFGKVCYWCTSLAVIFHVATLMPNKEKDPNCNSKKLHIGNDNVIIIYNDSKKDVNLGIIKVSVVTIPGLTLVLLVANFANSKWHKKMTEND